MASVILTMYLEFSLDRHQAVLGGGQYPFAIAYTIMASV